MPARNRPRLNITLDKKLKQKLKKTASDLDVTVSRLLEEVVREFFQLYDEDPLLGQTVRKKINDRKRNSTAPSSNSGDSRKQQQIKKILDNL